MILLLANIFQPLIDVADAVIVFFHDDVGLGWGPAIVALTFVTRIAIIPLSIKQIRSMRALQAYAPQMKEINEKYKDDPQRKQREMMAFYKENQINPLASCFPLLLQLPVFLALFYLLQSDEFQDQVLASPPEGWLFIPDLTEKATGAVLITLIVIYIATQLGAGLVMMATADRTQRMIMFGLPLIIVPFIINFPAGLIVYWITTNVWTVGQQYVVKKVAPPPAKATPEVVAAAKAAKPPPPPPRKKKRRR
ncbi:MAG: YidC/Oxa1 family membrane protein insertase [Solirubrobacterales bacterium]